MLGHGLFSLLNERLMLHSNQFSMTTYNVLFEILTEQICTQVIHKQHPDPDSNVKIVNPQVLKVIAALLKNSPLSPESMEVRRVFLSDMIKLFNNSKDNRRSLLQCSVWQDWMLSLSFINPKSSEEQKVTEMVYAIFRILLYHAIKYEWGGWRVWVDTLSITHSKVTFEQHKENLARMFRQYQRLGSEGDVAGIRTISGASRDSEILGQVRTNRDQGEETAPSTVIELTIDPEGVSQNQESPNTTPPSATSTASASTPSPPEREGDRSQRGQAPITVSNMLARAEEEEKEELQQVQNQISEDQRGGAGDRPEATTQETEAKLTEDKVSSKTVEAMAETETATDKTDDAAASSTAETDEATKPGTDVAKVAKTETSDGAKTSDTDKVVRPQTDGEKGSETHSYKDANVLMSEDSLNEPKEPELAKQPEEQVSAAVSACQKGSVAEGSAVGASVQSVSDQVRPSSTDDSMEESSFVSAAGGEEQEKETEEVKTEEVKTEEVKKEEVKKEEVKTEEVKTEEVVVEEEKMEEVNAEEIKTEEVVVEEEKMEEVNAEEIKTEEVKTEKKKEEESVAEVTKSAVESQETPPASVPEESQTQPPQMEEIDLDPSAPGTLPTNTGPAQQPLESTTSPPTALDAILPTPAAVGATVSKSDTSQAVAPTEAPSTKAIQPEAPQASGATEAPSTRTDTSPKVASATAVEAGKDSAAEGPGSATKTKEIHIARLDVSSVASDTERLELKETSTPEVPQGDAAAAGASGGQARESSSSSARSTMFRIPEFRWSHMHQRLLTDLLFSIETDVQMWRSHSTKTVMDFVNSSENVVFVHNTVHLISQVVDNLIMACGGILPLLSAATSSSHDLENIEPSQGLSVEASVTFLQRLINLVDVLIFASSLNFTEIEAEKNMSSGGILRQSLRLVCAMAVRNCLECQQHSHFKPSQDSARGQQAVHSLMGAPKSMPAQSPVDVVTGGMSPIRDMDRLLQEMDINRLRAVVFRDIEDSKQAQFLALAVVYFISVLMVSKYRDILEPQNDKKPPQRSQSARSADSNAVSGGPELESSVSLRRRDSGIGDDHSSVAPSEADSTAQGPDAVSEALSTLSSEVRGHRDNTTADARGGKNVKDILRSLVSAPADDIMVDPSLLPPAFLGAAMGNNPNQFRSFDRSVRVAPKKVGGAPSPGSSTPVPSATAAVAAAGTPVNNVAVVSTGDASQSTTAEAAAGSASANLPSVPTLSPMTRDTAPSMSISERLEHALEKAAPLLREIFVDFAPFLSRTLLGSHGQELLIEGTSLVCMKSSSSVVELVMLLCSQEWQNSIQKNAGLAFIELVNEGRLLSHTMKDHLVRVANEAEFILSRQRTEDIHKHAEFESHCAQYSAEKRDEEKMCDHLIRAAKYRDHVTATQLIQKIDNILTDKHGAWGSSAFSRPREFWRLDYWEDDLRRRRRFVRNPFGSTHSKATLKAAAEHAPEEDVLKGKQSIRSQALGNQNSESEILLDGDDDTLSSLEEKELENLTGPVNMSTSAQLVAPAVVVKGTLSITASELYFEVDEEEASFKTIDPKHLQVMPFCSIKPL
eukprot:XP_014050435.1 PREDICTED: lipopolysaccharide-responsive and beige-like anchor protein [Salmo salar]